MKHYALRERLVIMLYPAVTISLSSFHYWFSDPVLTAICARIIQKFSSNVGGFEIPLYFNEIDSWITHLSKGNNTLPGIYQTLTAQSQKTVLEHPHNSIHLDDFKQLEKGREAWLADSLNRMSELTGITLFTIHPDEVSIQRWSDFLPLLAPHISISIENMCYRKTNFQSLNELATLLDTYKNLSVTFDMSHWLELGNSLQSFEVYAFLAKYPQRVRKIHLSSYQSTAKEYRLSPETAHYFCVDSGLDKEHFNISEFFKQNSPILVLEGLIPFHDIEMLDRELEFVSTLVRQEERPLETGA